MFIQPLVGWVKSLANQRSKLQTYGTELETYIVANNPQNNGDIDRLTRQYDQRMANRSDAGWMI